MHKILDRMIQVDKDTHPANPLYEGLMGSVVKFAEEFTADSSIKAAESEASAARFESEAAKAQLDAVTIENSRLISELGHAKGSKDEAIERFNALSLEMKQMKSDWRIERQKLITEGKGLKKDLSLEKKELSELSGKLDALLVETKKSPAPIAMPASANTPLPTFDISVVERGSNDKIKKVTLTPRGN